MGIAVVDASLLVDAFSPTGERARRAKLALAPIEPVAPAHARIETIGAWRKHSRMGTLSDAGADGAIAALMRLDLREVSTEPLLPRIWELRHNLTAADAAYVALAERWDVPVLTSDAGMANAPGSRCEFRLIE